MSDRQHASNEYDMLKGCVNRLFVTDDIDELPRLYRGAIYHLGEIYEYGLERLREKETAEKAEKN